jgi:hypothetical protein
MLSLRTELDLESAAAALLFCAIFLLVGTLRPLRWFFREERTAVSFGAGIATAYVFVHVMPELNAARHAFEESTSLRLHYEGMSIFYVSLVGFLMFYGQDSLQKRLQQDPDRRRAVNAFIVSITGFAVYVGLMAYLLVHNLEDTPRSVALFAVAIAVHFLGVDRVLRDEHGTIYERIGRFILAVMPLLGWGIGMLMTLPRSIIALMVAFISGAVIMNSSITELRTESKGHFLPFMFGGLAYGLILLPIG